MSNLSSSNGWNKFWNNLFDANQKNNQTLIACLEDGNVAGVRQALLDGADPNYTNDVGATPLHLAACLSTPIVIPEMLIECGANIYRMDENGNTALHLAAQFGNLALASLLLAHHANVNTINYYGYSALDYAIKFNCSDIARVLVMSGAMPSVEVDDVVIYASPYIAMPYHVVDEMVFVMPTYDYEPIMVQEPYEIITTYQYDIPQPYEYQYEVTTTTTTYAPQYYNPYIPEASAPPYEPVYEPYTYNYPVPSLYAYPQDNIYNEQYYDNTAYPYGMYDLEFPMM
ncbi:MAG: ankyrin repeat domain-containing protein [Proteobacteria bacterium]|nr:ankyrin repeat domain-containing protein [Pseudomonadota bacterium]